MKKIISILTVTVMILGWLVVFKNIGGSFISYEKSLSLAKESVENGLYEQGVQYYKQALSYKSGNKEIYKNIKEAYRLFAEEQQNSYSYNRYISSLEECCEKYGNNLELWEELISEYYETKSYDDCNSAIKRANNQKVTSEKIEEISFFIKHIYTVSYKNIKSYKIGRNGTYTVSDGNTYWVEKFSGDTVGIHYVFVGPLDENGKGVFVDNAGANIRDSSQITRVKLTDAIVDSGYFNSGVAPVKAGEKWIYINEDGTDTNIGEFDNASSMYEGTAAVQQSDSWNIIDKTGNAVITGSYEDVELDMYGSYTNGDHFLAKESGKFNVYSPSGEKVVSINAEQVDVSTFSELFAFKDRNSGLWGYCDWTGNIVIEPTYANAKGFSNGYAAVANEDGLWGIIDVNNRLVVTNEFYYVGYFTKDNGCFVSRTEGAMGLLTFIYQ